MKILELFAGSRSIGKVAEELGFQAFSCDIYNFGSIDYVEDILNFDYQKVQFIPDIIWASPPCTTYSIASCGTHRNLDRSPKTKDAEIGDKIVLKTLEIIKYYKKLNPNLKWYIENPRGILRKMSFMQNIGIRNTVTYCQYGDGEKYIDENGEEKTTARMKPTDIWTNNGSWIPKKMCKNGDPCHQSAPRGSKTGTQGRKNAHQRSIIPRDLCLEILSLDV